MGNHKTNVQEAITSFRGHTHQIGKEVARGLVQDSSVLRQLGHVVSLVSTASVRSLRLWWSFQRLVITLLCVVEICKQRPKIAVVVSQCQMKRSRKVWRWFKKNTVKVMQVKRALFQGLPISFLIASCTTTTTTSLAKALSYYSVQSRALVPLKVGRAGQCGRRLVGNANLS